MLGPLLTLTLLLFQQFHEGYAWGSLTSKTSDSGNALAVMPSSASVSSNELGLAQRSINDWQLTNFVLVSTIDGMIQARERRTGALLWSLGGEPLVRVEQVIGDGDQIDLETVWITEPDGDGGLYYFNPSSGLERIPASIKDLIEKAPFAMKDGVVYTGSKSTVLYTLNATTGEILHSYGKELARSVEKKSVCEAAPSDDWFPLQSGMLLIGRSDYVLEIHEKRTSKAWRLYFSRWSSNTRDVDLARQYNKPLDSLYVTPILNNTVIAMAPNDYRQNRWHAQIPSAAVQVFDVLTPISSLPGSDNAPLVILSQPPLQVHDQAPRNKDVYVGQTTFGDFFALSGANYNALLSSSVSAPWCVGTHRSFRSLGELANLIVGVHPEWCQVKSFVTEPTLPDHNRPGIENKQPPMLIDPPPPVSSSLKKITSRILENVATFLAMLLLAYLASKQGLIPGLYEIFELWAWWKLQQEQQKKQVGDTAIVSVYETSGDRASNQTLVEPSSDLKEVSATELESSTGSARTPSPGLGTKQSNATVVPDLTFTKENGNLQPSSSSVSLNTLADGEGKQRRKRGSRGGKKVREAKERAEQKVGFKGNDDDSDEASSSVSSQSADALRALGPFYITQEVLGSGSHGTAVYKGIFQSREVAIKRLVRTCYDVASQEVEILQESDDHPNVIRYFCSHETEDCLFLALELCQASLEEVIRGESLRETISTEVLLDLQARLRPLDTLQQITKGLHHLHSLKIVHRDIKPQNILVAYPKPVHVKDKTKLSKVVYGPPRLLISDFGLCKKLEGEQSSFQATTNAHAGTVGWTAPEISMDSRYSLGTINESSSSDVVVPDMLRNQSRRLTRAVDIFSLGCVFYYTLSPRQHPFGDGVTRQINIERQNYSLDELDRFPFAVEARDLISQMISFDPRKRPDTAEILQHPLFWSDQEKLDFLVKVSDRLENESREEHSVLLERLERHAEKIVGGDWPGRFPKAFLDNLGKYRKYHGDRIIDLLRALRNKFHHYNDFTPEMKKLVGAVPSGYLVFFTGRFPYLLMEVYGFVKENLASEDAFSPYFVYNHKH